MEPDKRRFVRKRTDQLLYAEFGPDNGSILLNLSEDGCSFQSMAPVRDEQLRFSVSVGDGRKLEGDGQMVWSDTAKKTGGLRFLNPSQELREQVREWLDETVVTAEGKLDAAALESKAKRQRKKRRDERSAEAEGVWNGGALKAGQVGSEVETEVSALERAADGTTPGVRDEIRHAEVSPLSPSADPRPRASLRGAGAIALGAVLLVTVIGYRRELGHGVMSFGSSIAGDEQSHSGAAGPPVAVDTGSAKPAADPAASKPPPISDEELANETSAESVTARPNAAEGASGGVLKHSALQQSSAPQSARQQSEGEDVPALWWSVENGDTRAEVTLANRYVHGEGVPQSCAQARVLLEAAAKRGSTDAKEKLEGLPQAGCP